MLKEVHRQWRLATCLPQEFVESYSKLCAQGQKAWQEARKADDFKGFAPFLSQIIDACKQKAEYIGYDAAPYDALLNEYEPGMTTAELKTVFKQLRDGTMELLKALEGSNAPDESVITKSFDLDKQWDVGVAHLKNLGYDFNTGRQDKSAHPFSTSFIRLIVASRRALMRTTSSKGFCPPLTNVVMPCTSKDCSLKNSAIP